MLRGTKWRKKQAQQTVMTLIKEDSGPEIDQNSNLSVMELFIIYYEVLEKHYNDHPCCYDISSVSQIISGILSNEAAIELGILDWLDENSTNTSDKVETIRNKFKSMIDEVGIEIFNYREEISYYVNDNEAVG